VPFTGHAVAILDPKLGHMIMFLVEWHTLHVPGSVFEQLWQLSHSDYCLLSSLTCEWKCSETDRNKAGM